MRALAVIATMVAVMASSAQAQDVAQRIIAHKQCMNAIGQLDICSCISENIADKEQLAGMDFINYVKIASFDKQEQDARTNLVKLSDEEKKQMEGYIAGIREIQQFCGTAAASDTTTEETTQ